MNVLEARANFMGLLMQGFSRDDPRTYGWVVSELQSAISDGNVILICGNGGSAAQASHFAGELVGAFRDRKLGPLHCIALGTDPAVTTAIANDYGYDEVFARQVRALGMTGYVLIGISTSGKSENVLKALRAGQEMGMVTVLLTGDMKPSEAGKLADYYFCVSSPETPDIQECHQLLLHSLCVELESCRDGAPG